jgi:hypothetical protein
MPRLFVYQYLFLAISFGLPEVSLKRGFTVDGLVCCRVNTLTLEEAKVLCRSVPLILLVISHGLTTQPRQRPFAAGEACYCISAHLIFW